MPMLSIVIPVYNNCKYVTECLQSVLSQDFQDTEIIVVDDCSTDRTPEIIEALSRNDSRIRFVRHATNLGTLAARNTGVTSSRGRYVMFIDQDDTIQPGTLSKLVQIVRDNPADIYHFGVSVEASNAEAKSASAGMAQFLTPTPRTLLNHAILRTQFSPTDGFDWHLHHKLFSGSLLRQAYHASAHTRLLLSDDLYMNFIIDSLASRYLAIPDSPWYVYHLGRGETFGTPLSVKTLRELSQRDAKGLRLIEQFVNGPYAPRRNDWGARVADVRDRLCEHTMNEWKDNLTDSEKLEGLDIILASWPPDSVCAELYRYIRDSAYAYLQSTNRSGNRATVYQQEVKSYVKMVHNIEHQFDPARSDNTRYHDMKAIAERHMMDSQVLDAPTKHRNYFANWFHHRSR